MKHNCQNENKLLSHVVKPKEIEKAVAAIKERIILAGDKKHVTVEKQLQLLKQLAAFDFGRFLIQHGGLNGYWTHYVLMHPKRGRVTGKNNRGENFSDLEKMVLDRFYFVLATQERFNIFLSENQKEVKNGAKLACIPSGMMGELLYLDFNNANEFELFGIDFDEQAILDAKKLAEERSLQDKVKWVQCDAWKINSTGQFNLISSNGLNIYEPNDEKLIALYKIFYEALLFGGKLVTSFLTYPPSFADHIEWKMNGLDKEILLLQRIVFSDILNSKFMCFRTSNQTKGMLESVGFKDIKFISGTHHIFPTVVAKKR